MQIDGGVQLPRKMPMLVCMSIAMHRERACVREGGTAAGIMHMCHYQVWIK
jgi:hypothetical protein